MRSAGVAPPELLEAVMARQGKKLGAEIAFLCPAHEDHTPSANYNPVKETWICRSCGAKGGWTDLAARLNVQTHVASTGKLIVGSKKAVIVATYTYTDETGTVLYAKDRLEPKSFRLRRATASGWTAALGDVRRVLYRLPELVAADPALGVFLCYSSDTEILTERGWILLSSMKASDQVAQYDQDTGRVSFVVPVARQCFDYSGPMVHVAAEFSDLLVTPDHRMLVSYPRCNPKVVCADALKIRMRIPVAGWNDGATDGPTPDQGRLITSLAADGQVQSRGFQITWNLKKERKKERLRTLLQVMNIPWQEHVFPSVPDWTLFTIDRRHAPWLLSFLPNKEWSWGTTCWPLRTRLVILDELTYWDGDHTGKEGGRYFTASKANADVIAGVAALTGWGCIVRRDDRANRPEQRTQYVVNLMPRAFRSLGNAPVYKNYDGRVYCCTVPSGFLVVRRNGKTTIAGNCEGEKDADNLAALGFVATTNDSGAGKWAGAYTETLRGRHIILLPHNDAPGRSHQALLTTALSGVVASIKVVTFLDLEEHGDVSDWLAEGHTADELNVLVQAAPTIKPPPGRVIPTRMKAKDLMQRILPPIKWAVPDFLPEGLTILAGRPKSGKSWLALQLALGVSSGAGALGRPAVGGEVLYVALEDRMGRLQSRMAMQSEDEAIITNRLELWTDCPRLDDGGLDQIAAWCEANPEARMVIVDTLQKIRGKQKANGNAYEDDYATIGSIKERIADTYQVAVVIIHHTRKMSADNPLESISGTYGLGGAADSGMVLLRQSGTAEAVLHSTGRDVEETQLALAWHSDTCTWELLGDAEHHRKNVERQTIVDIIAEAGEPLTAREIAGRIGRKLESLKMLVSRMARDGEIEPTGSGKYTVPVTAVIPGTPVTPVTPVTAPLLVTVTPPYIPPVTVTTPSVTPVTHVTPITPITPVTPINTNGLAHKSETVLPRARNDDGRCAMPDCRGIVVTWEIDPDRPHMYTGVCKHGHQNWMKA